MFIIPLTIIGLVLLAVILVAIAPYLQTIGLIMAVILLFGLAGYVVMFLLEKYRQLHLLNPDDNGNYPVERTKQGIIQVQAQNFVQFPNLTHYTHANHVPRETYKQLDSPIVNAISSRDISFDEPVDLELELEIDNLHPAKKKELPILIGVNNGKQLIFPLHNLMHMGFLGTSGAGKSSAQRSLLYQLNKLDPTGIDVRFNLFDIENKELRTFRNATNTDFFSHDVDKCKYHIDELLAIMDELIKLDDISEVPYRLIVIEEMLDFMNELNSVYKEKLFKLFRRGRKARIYLVGASQIFNSGEVGIFAKQMMNARFCFKTEAESARAFGFNGKDIQQLNQSGMFMYNLRLYNSAGIAKAPYISPEAVKIKLLEKPHDETSSIYPVSNDSMAVKSGGDYEKIIQEQLVINRVMSVSEIKKFLDTTQYKAYELYKLVNKNAY